MPNVAMGVIERSSQEAFRPGSDVLFPFSSDKSIAVRVDLALAALSRSKT